MTPRSLFNIVLKILGIFFIKDILATIPQLLTFGAFLMEPDTTGIWFTFLATIIILLIYILVSFYLVFKSDLIIDWLKLDKGFDQDMIPLDIHRSTILSIAIIVIGGLMVAEEIPVFCQQLFLYIQEKKMTYGQTNPSLSYSILAGIKILIGFLLMGNQRQIVNFIEHRRKR